VTRSLTPEPSGGGPARKLLNGTEPEVHTTVSETMDGPPWMALRPLQRIAGQARAGTASICRISPDGWAIITSFLSGGLLLRGNGSSSGAPHDVGEPKRVECGAQRQQPGDLSHPVQGYPPLKRGAEFLPP
jgi:hypothetical protein